VVFVVQLRRANWGVKGAWIGAVTRGNWNYAYTFHCSKSILLYVGDSVSRGPVNNVVKLRVPQKAVNWLT